VNYFRGAINGTLAGSGARNGRAISASFSCKGVSISATPKLTPTSQTIDGTKPRVTPFFGKALVFGECATPQDFV
jgi:hypothetical protein